MLKHRIVQVYTNAIIYRDTKNKFLINSNKILDCKATLYFIVMVYRLNIQGAYRMKIKEVEDLLQITRANIRFYEKEGLLTPVRGENQYRTYSDDDIDTLKKIILFRKLGISIDDIRSILKNKDSLKSVVGRNIISLNYKMDELKGAIEICKRIENDPAIDNDFDLEKYWYIVDQEERKGNAFFSYFKDYIEFEGNVFKRIWSSVFFYDLDQSVKKRGWAIALIIILGICIIRGLAYQFIWKWGDFWYGFSYPFGLFLFYTIVTLPIYILNRKYGKKVNEQENAEVIQRKKVNLPFLGLWKFLGGVIYLLMLLVGIPLLGEKLIFNHIMGRDTNYIITGSPFVLYIISGLYLFCIFIWLYSKQGLFGNIFSSEKGIRAHLPTHVKTKVLLLSVCVFIISAIINSTWYDCITEDGITKKHFIWSKSYTWEDVNYYELSAKFDGTLRYSIIMKDGSSISCFGDTSFSNIDEQKYPSDENDFMLMLTREFAEQGISIKVKNWNKLYKKLSYDYWDNYVDEIRMITQQ